MSLVLALSLLDVASGLLLFAGIKQAWPIGLFLLLKGAISIIGSISSGFVFDFAGASDTLSGVSFVLIGAGYSNPVIQKIGMIQTIKGMLMLVFSLPAMK